MVNPKRTFTSQLDECRDLMNKATVESNLLASELAEYTKAIFELRTQVYERGQRVAALSKELK